MWKGSRTHKVSGSKTSSSYNPRPRRQEGTLEIIRSPYVSLTGNWTHNPYVHGSTLLVYRYFNWMFYPCIIMLHHVLCHWENNGLLINVDFSNNAFYHSTVLKPQTLLSPPIREGFNYWVSKVRCGDIRKEKAWLKPVPSSCLQHRPGHSAQREGDVVQILFSPSRAENRPKGKKSERAVLKRKEGSS